MNAVINILINLCIKYTAHSKVYSIQHCDKICQWLVAGQWFSLGTLVSSTSKTDSHKTAEILLKVASPSINYSDVYIMKSLTGKIKCP
jgi:hypothetical protein